MTKWKWRVLSALYIFVVAVITYYVMVFIKEWYDSKVIPWPIAAGLVVLFSSVVTVSRDCMSEADKSSALNAVKKEKDDLERDLNLEIETLNGKILDKDNIIHAFKSTFTHSFISCKSDEELVLQLRSFATKIVDTPEMNNIAPSGGKVMELMMKLR